MFSLVRSSFRKFLGCDVSPQCFFMDRVAPSIVHLEVICRQARLGRALKRGVWNPASNNVVYNPLLA